MIGIDTNVLVRWFVDDDPRQAAAARRLLTAADRAGNPILVSPLVLAELEWILRSRFRRSKAEILEALDALCEEADIVIDDRSSVEVAIDTWRGGTAGFADYLIAALARDRGATTTLTFDREAARTAVFTLLTA